MRTRLFVLFLFLLLATALIFAACDGNPAAPSDISSESSDLAAASSGDVSSNMPSAESDASEEDSAAPSADASGVFSDTSDTSSEESFDPDSIRAQLKEPYDFYVSYPYGITITVENPNTDDEHWRFWLQNECLYDLGTGTRVGEYNVSVDSYLALNLISSNGTIVFTDRTGKTTELAGKSAGVFLDPSGSEVVPFGEYESLTVGYSTYVVAQVKEGEMYILDGKGERLTEQFAEIERCRAGYSGSTFHVTETDGETYQIYFAYETGELKTEPMHNTTDREEYVAEAFMWALDPFFNAVKDGDGERIAAIIGRERYESAAALVDTLEPDYEPYQDYTSLQTDEQNPDKYMAFLLKYGRYMESPSFIHYLEKLSLSDQDPYWLSDFSYHGFANAIGFVATFEAVPDENGLYALIDLRPSVTYFPEVP